MVLVRMLLVVLFVVSVFLVDDLFLVAVLFALVLFDEEGAGVGSEESEFLSLPFFLSIPRGLRLLCWVAGTGRGWPSVVPVLRLTSTERHTLKFTNETVPQVTQGVNVVTSTSMILVTGLSIDRRLVLTGVDIRVAVSRKTIIMIIPDMTRVTMKEVYPSIYFWARLYAVFVSVMGVNMTVTKSRVPWTSRST